MEHWGETVAMKIEDGEDFWCVVSEFLGCEESRQFSYWPSGMAIYQAVRVISDQPCGIPKSWWCICRTVFIFLWICTQTSCSQCTTIAHFCFTHTNTDTTTQNTIDNVNNVSACILY
jgi:hypothetical protein